MTLPGRQAPVFAPRPWRLFGAPAHALEDAPESDEVAPDIASSTERYADRFAGPGGRFLLERQTEGLRRLIEPIGGAGLRTMDVGGGHLQVAPLLAELGHSVVVHGSTEWCLARVPTLAAFRSGRVECRPGSLWRLPADDREFDLVVGIRMLGHVARWRELLAEMCRVTRRALVVEFAAASGFQRLSGPLFGLKRRLEGNTRYFFTYDPAEIAGELDRLGFRTVAVDRQFTLPVVMHRMLQQPTLSRAAERVLSGIGLTSRVGSPVLLLAERAEADQACSAVARTVGWGRGPARSAASPR